MSINRNSDDIDKKALSDQTGDNVVAFITRHYFGIVISTLLAMFFLPAIFGFTGTFIILAIFTIIVFVVYVYNARKFSESHIIDISMARTADIAVNESRIDEDEDEEADNLWKLARRYYEIYRHRAPEKRKLAYEFRHRILDFMDLRDYIEDTEYEDEANELYDRLYYDLNRTCDILEKVDADDRQVIDNILISTFHGLSWIFIECDNIIERMMEIYDAITADDRKVETDVLLKPTVTSSVPTITKKEEKPTKKDPEIEDLYSVRNARLFPR